MNKLLQIPKKLFDFWVLLILAKHNYAINYIEIPKNNAVVSGDNVLVAWNRINSFTNYELSVSSSATFTSFTKYTATTTSFSIPATGLTSGTIYYLRIRGFAGNVKTGWSSVVNFTYFNPATDPNLKIWLKADKGVILSAGKVATWQDQSPNLNHANQPNVIQQPTVVNEPLLNNKPSIKLDGDDDYLVFNDIPNIRSVFLLLKHDSGIGSYQSILGGDPSYDFLGEDGTPLFDAGAPVLSKIISCNLNKTGVAANQLIKPTKYILLDIATTANVDANHIAMTEKCIQEDDGMESMQKFYYFLIPVKHVEL
ncbi:MAG: fibronectin type III domain-containing protein [Saprospirales bacterium]|nr:fibronectin type III domain-containing protein [Saprospirales bacterium]